MRTRNISASVISDALRVCGSIYSMNARHARGYGFLADKENKEVCCGSFLYGRDALQWDGVIDLQNKTLTDVDSGEVRSLA